MPDRQSRARRRKALTGIFGFVAVIVIAGCSSSSSSGSAAAGNQPATSVSAPAVAFSPAPAQANGGSVADCEGAFMADVGQGAARLAEDEAKADAGTIPACAGLTRQQIADAYSNALFYLPQASAPASSQASSQSSRATSAQTITYEVTGSPANVTYGPAGSSLSGSVPMKVTAKLGDPLYYSLQAQLQGGGSVTVKILVNSTVTSQGTASGGYNIAMAEVSQDPLSGQWTDTDQG